MGVYKKAVITSAGSALTAKALAGETTILFSHASTSDYSYASGTSFESLSSLLGVKQTALPSDVLVVSDTMIRVRVMFGNENILKSYLVQNVGLYAMDGDTEILFAVCQAETPDQVPAYNGVAPSSFVYDIQLAVSQASAIQTTVTPAGTITVQEFEKAKKEIRELEEAKVELRNLHRTVTVYLPLADWSSTAPYSLRLPVSGVKSTDVVKVYPYTPKELAAADIKARRKLTAMLTDVETGDGYVVFYCGEKKPTGNFTVLLEGVSANG